MHTPHLFDHVKQLGSRKGRDIQLTSSIVDTFMKLDTAFCKNLLLRMLEATKSPSTASDLGNILEGKYLRSLMTRELLFVTQLTTTQKQILEVILANDLYWKGHGNFNLNIYGLAEKRSELRQQVKNATIVG